MLVGRIGWLLPPRFEVSSEADVGCTAQILKYKLVLPLCVKIVEGVLS